MSKIMFITLINAILALHAENSNMQATCALMAAIGIILVMFFDM